MEGIGAVESEPGSGSAHVAGELVKDTYDVPSLIRSEIASMRQVIRDTEADCDRFNLLPLYRRQLKSLEQIDRKPISEDPYEQVQIVRKIHQGSGEGIGNVLDVLSVSNDGGPFHARPLRNEEMLELFGTVTPTLSQAAAVEIAIFTRIERGESVCFPVYKDRREPAGGGSSGIPWIEH